MKSITSQLKDTIPPEMLRKMTNQLGGLLGVNNPKKTVGLIVWIADYHRVLHEYGVGKVSKDKPNPMQVFQNRQNKTKY